MTPEMVLQLGRNALEMTLILAGPVLLFGLIAGLVVALIRRYRFGPLSPGLDG